jgi:hypothetical protein
MQSRKALKGPQQANKPLLSLSPRSLPLSLFPCSPSLLPLPPSSLPQSLPSSHLAQEEQLGLVLLNGLLDGLVAEGLTGRALQVHHVTFKREGREGKGREGGFTAHLKGQPHDCPRAQEEALLAAISDMWSSAQQRLWPPPEHSPPKRLVMSHTLAPQMPALPTTTLSPGSTRFEMHASMPACPVPLTMRVYLESVCGGERGLG